MDHDRVILPTRPIGRTEVRVTELGFGIASPGLHMLSVHDIGRLRAGRCA